MGLGKGQRDIEINRKRKLLKGQIVKEIMVLEPQGTLSFRSNKRLHNKFIKQFTVITALLGN